MNYYEITGYSYEFSGGTYVRRMYRRVEVQTKLQVIKTLEDVNDQIRKTGSKRCRYVTNVSLIKREDIVEDTARIFKLLRDAQPAPFYVHNGKIDLLEYLMYSWDEYFQDVPIKIEDWFKPSQDVLLQNNSIRV